MNAKHVVTAGLFADFTAEAARFVRSFDDHKHDIANTYSEKQAFLDRLRALFGQCRILAEVPEGTPGETATHIAVSQAMALGTVYYNDRVLNLWPATAKAQALSTLAEKQDLVQDVAARINAEFAPNSLVMDFAALDLNLWHSVLRKAESCQEDAASLALSHLRKKAFRLVRAHPRVTDVQGVCSELCRLAVKLCKELRRAEPGVAGLSAGPGSFCKDNRLVWGRAMAGGLSPGLYAVVCWYISIIDCTGQVERDLGSLRKVLETHVGPTDGQKRGIACAVEIYLDGPEREEDLVVHECLGPSHTHGAPGKQDVASWLAEVEGTPLVGDKITPFLRTCAERWVELHGRRFNCRIVAPKPKKQTGPRPGTDLWVRARQKHAADACMQVPCAKPLESIFGGSLQTLERQARELPRAASGPQLHGRFVLVSLPLDSVLGIRDSLRPAGSHLH